MTWTAGTDLASGTVVTSTIWNSYLGTSGSLNYLKASPAFTGQVKIGSGADAIGINTLLINPTDTTHHGIVIDLPTSTSASHILGLYNGASRFSVNALADKSSFVFNSMDFGNDKAGPYVEIGCNAHAGGVAGAAGAVVLAMADNNVMSVWSDATGDLRIHTASPTGSTGSPTVADTAGTVVGDQTSWHELKNIIGAALEPEFYLREIVNTIVEEFTYKNSGYKSIDNQDQKFTGLIVRDKTEWFAKNCGPQQIPCLNEISAIGYLVQSIKALNTQIEELKRRLLVKTA